MNKRQAKKKRKKQEEIARIYEFLEIIRECLQECTQTIVKEVLQRAKGGDAEG